MPKLESLKKNWINATKWIRRPKVAATLAATLLVLAEFVLGFLMVQEPVVFFNSSSNLATDRCTVLLQHDHEVLLGTDVGVFIYDPFEIPETALNNILNESHASDQNPYRIRVLDATYQRQFGYYVLTQDFNGGLYRVSPDFEPMLIDLAKDNPSFGRYFTNIVACQEEPLIVLGGGGNNLYVYNQSSYNATVSKENGLLDAVNDLLCIGHEVLVASNLGLCIYNITESSFLEFSVYASDNLVSINAIEYDKTEELVYLGTSHGLYVYHRLDDNMTLVRRYNEADGIVAGEITCIELDLTTDTMYVGTRFGLSAIDLRSMKLLKNYIVFSTQLPDIKSVLLYRRGNVRRLMIASGLGGFASIGIHNLPTLLEFVDTHASDIVGFIAVPFGIIALYLNQQKKFPREFLYYYVLILFLLVVTWWLFQLWSTLSIPQMRPEGALA